MLAAVTALLVTSCAPGPAVNAAPPTDADMCPNTAAAQHDWGPPNRKDDFNDPFLTGWHVYDGPGHAGNGRRTPHAISAADGVLTITGDGGGRSGG
ncbi:MAG TPA: glycoside hydrolase, partial [Mycobacterium sp.]